MKRRGTWLACALLTSACAPHAIEGTRGVPVTAAPAAESAAIHRYWAVIIGVSQYEDPRIPTLRYASDDARAFEELVASSRFGAGGIPPERRLVLLDDSATVPAARAALFEFLGRADRDDFVVVFFAGHGVPDPAHPGDVYLLLHDSRVAHLPSTAISMEEVHRAFERVRADRVVLFADACHSAGIALPDGTRTRAVGGNGVNRFLEELARSRRNRLVLTSSDVDEVSLEGPRWRHGIFTWALLQALAGAADRAGNRDGIVQLGEAVDWVRDTVESESGLTQHPVVTGEFDGRLPLALTSAGTATTSAAESTPTPPSPSMPVALPAPVAMAGEVVDLGELVIAARQHKPFAAIDVAQPTLDFAPGPDELRAAPAPIRTALEAWQQAREQRGRRIDALRSAAAAGAAGAGAEAEAEAAERKAQDEVSEKTQALVAALAGPPLESLSPSMQLLLAKLEWLATMDAQTDASAASPDAPPPNLDEPVAIVDGWLQRNPDHPLRPQAQLLRVYLEEERGGRPIDVGAICLRALAERADHPYGAYLNWEMASAWLNSGDVRLREVARQALEDARAGAAHDENFLGAVLGTLASLDLDLGRLDDAQSAAIQLVSLDDEVMEKERVEGFLLDVVERSGKPDRLAGRVHLNVDMDVRDGIASDRAERNDSAGGAPFAERALALAPLDPRAIAWDALLAKAAEVAGDDAAAAQRLSTRWHRFGPGSAWFGANGRGLSRAQLEQLQLDAAHAAELSAPATEDPAAAAAAFSRPLWHAYSACYEKDRRDDPLRKGSIALRFSWDDSGRVSAFTVDANDTGSGALAGCAEHVVRATRTRGRAGTARLRLTFVEQ